MRLVSLNAFRSPFHLSVLNRCLAMAMTLDHIRSNVDQYTYNGTPTWKTTYFPPDPTVMASIEALTIHLHVQLATSSYQI